MSVTYNKIGHPFLLLSSLLNTLENIAISSQKHITRRARLPYRANETENRQIIPQKLSRKSPLKITNP